MAMIAAKQISAEVDVRLSCLQKNYAHLQGIATFLAKVVMQMHKGRFRDSHNKSIPGNWQGLSAMAKVSCWHELPHREPLAESQGVSQQPVVDDVIWI